MGNPNQNKDGYEIMLFSFLHFSAVAKLLGKIQSSVSRVVRRGERLALDNRYSLSDWEGGDAGEMLTFASVKGKRDVLRQII